MQTCVVSADSHW